MISPRNPKRDLFALALLVVCIFLGLAIFSYSPTDPPQTATFPQSAQIHNACGWVGAYAADRLFTNFGLGVYFLLLSLVVLDLFLLARYEITEPWLRAIGWTLALAGICTLSALVSPAWNGPLIGPGGILGAAGRGWLESHFASVGSYLFTLSMIIAGLLLCTDYVLVRLAALIMGPPAKGLAVVGRKSLQVSGNLTSRMLANRPKRPATDVELAAEELAAASGEAPPPKVNLKSKPARELDPAVTREETEISDPAIKIRGKAVKQSPPAVAELTEEVESEELEETAEESTDEVDSTVATTAIAPATAGNTPKPSAAPVPIKNLKNADRDRVIQELEAASRQTNATEYELPSIELLLPNEAVYKEEHEKEVRVKAKQIEKTFADFGFNVKVVEIETGPVIAQYEVELEAGLRLAKITNLADDLAIALRVPSVRIVAPIPGKNTVGIEVPNNERQLVRLREVIEETNGKSKKMKIPIFLGKDVAGNPLTVDLTTLPHLLIAGRTGTGKSVCLNSIIVSMLMTRRPDEVKMLMIDPKMVELSPYKKLPHLMHPVVTDMRKAEAILAWAVEKMEERYALLARAGVRHISVYNQLGDEELRDRLRPENEEEWASIPRTLPFIVIVADEMADLMMTAGKEVEQHIIRLAQKSRAVGIHLILATQKPTVDVITGLIKSNLPARIAFQVASRTDSRVVLDEMGADKLLGNGDLLFLWPGTSNLLRGQGTYLSDDEINRVVDFVGTSEPEFVKELVQLKSKDQQTGDVRERIKSRDDLYESAVEIVIREGRGSVSLLQRALGIGYGRAARMVDFMAEDGVVGEYNGSNAREVLLTIEQWNELMGNETETPATVAPSPVAKTTANPPKANRILPERFSNGGAGGGDHPADGRGQNGGEGGGPRGPIRQATVMPLPGSAPRENALPHARPISPPPRETVSNSALAGPGGRKFQIHSSHQSAASEPLGTPKVAELAAQPLGSISTRDLNCSRTSYQPTPWEELDPAGDSSFTEEDEMLADDPATAEIAEENSTDYYDETDSEEDDDVAEQDEAEEWEEEEDCDEEDLEEDEEV
ncbi:MAG: DNA translocase FtsK [Pirellulales bacterium]|nr:DNA translocase FtsK [Pirellulales bacterium]